MTVRIDRRQFLMGSTALLASGALSSGLSPALAQEVVLRMIFWGGQDRADRTYSVAELYKEATGVAVEGEFLSFADYWAKLATQTAGGSAPDVVQMDGVGRYVIGYAERGALAPLNEFVGNELKLDDFDEDQLAAGTINGDLYAISLGANAAAMVVNTAAFERAGVDLPGKMTTYDDIRAIGEAFNSKNVGMKVIEDGSGLWHMFENWLRQRGKALYAPDGTLGFDANDATEWFQLWADLRADGICVSPEDQALDAGGLETKMLSLGKAAMVGQWSNLLVAYQDLNQDRLTLTNLPRIAADSPNGHYRKPSMFFSVSATSEHRAEAAEFISFFVNDPEANKILGDERGIPCSAAVREVVAPTLGEQSRIGLQYVGDLGSDLAPPPPPPPAAAGEINESLLPMVSQEVGFGARSPEDGGQYLIQIANDAPARG